MWDNFLHYFQLGLPSNLTAEMTVASGPRDVFLSFTNHFPTTQISAPPCEQTSSTSPSSWHWNPPQQAAGRCSDPHICLSFQWMDCSWCQSCLVPPPVKNKSQILKTLSSPKLEKKKGGISLVMMKEFFHVGEYLTMTSACYFWYFLSSYTIFY